VVSGCPSPLLLFPICHFSCLALSLSPLLFPIRCFSPPWRCTIHHVVVQTSPCPLCRPVRLADSSVTPVVPGTVTLSIFRRHPVRLADSSVTPSPSVPSPSQFSGVTLSGLLIHPSPRHPRSRHPPNLQASPCVTPSPSVRHPFNLQVSALLIHPSSVTLGPSPSQFAGDTLSASLIQPSPRHPW
jgi:hypothetical protein